MLTKAIPFAMIVAVLSLSGFAEDARDNRVATESYVVKDGKVWIMKDGNTKEVTTETTFTDGNRLLADGTWVTADGTRTTSKNGDMFGMDGRRREQGNQAPNKDTQVGRSATGAPVNDNSRDSNQTPNKDSQVGRSATDAPGTDNSRDSNQAPNKDTQAGRSK